MFLQAPSSVVISKMILNYELIIQLKGDSGRRLNINMSFYQYKDSQAHDHLIFIMGIHT